MSNRVYLQRPCKLQRWGLGARNNLSAGATRLWYPKNFRVMINTTYAGRGCSGVAGAPRTQGVAANQLMLGDNPWVIMNERRHLQR